MSNHLKRRYSIDNYSQFKKRTRVISDIPSPETNDYVDPYTSPITYNVNINNKTASHLPPSPPVINDPVTPLSFPPTIINTIPTLKRFFISTKQQHPEITASNYTGINHLLYQLHIERYSENSSSIVSFNNGTDIEMINDNTYQYDSVNAVLKQAFLERHSPE